MPHFGMHHVRTWHRRTSLLVRILNVFAWSTTLKLTQSNPLTVQDAANLELVHRMALPLVSLDWDLRNASHVAEIELLGL